MRNDPTLNREKRLLAIAFTASVFLLMLGIEAVSLGYKYLDMRSREDQKLDGQANVIVAQYVRNGKPVNPENPVVGHGNVRPDGLPDRPSGPVSEGEPPIQFRNERFVIYETSTKKIVASSFSDTSFLDGVIAKAESVGSDRGTFEDEDTTAYRFVLVRPDAVHTVFVLGESRLSAVQFGAEFAVYLLVSLLVSIAVYLLSKAFVDRTLAPVERSMKDMEEFVHNAGHELKTPLAVMKSSLQLARAKNESSEHLAESVSELDKMNAIIDSLIALATIREDPKSRSAVSVRNTVDSVLHEYESKIRSKNLSVHFDRSADLCVRANPEYLRILVANVVSNAVKYNCESGSITLTVSPGSLEVTDTGIGISPEWISRAFDRFYQDSDVRNKDGWWIGLSIVRKIADIHGWKISLESEKWVGTTVRIAF